MAFLLIVTCLKIDPTKQLIPTQNAPYEQALSI